MCRDLIRNRRRIKIARRVSLSEAVWRRVQSHAFHNRFETKLHADDKKTSFLTSKMIFTRAARDEQVDSSQVGGWGGGVGGGVASVLPLQTLASRW